MALTDAELLELEYLLDLEEIDRARSNLLDFTSYTLKGFQPTWFHEVYYNLLNRFAEKQFKKLIISIPPQHGKQTSLSEPVLTTEGIKNHGDLKIGDFVYHPSGKPIEVIDYIPQKEPCDVEVGFSNGYKVKCHRNHLWTLEDKKGGLRTVETNQLFKERLHTGEFGKRGCRYLNYLPNHNNVNENSAKNLKIDPYTLGVWLGDGVSSLFKFTLSKDDFDYISPHLVGDISSVSEEPTTKNISFKNQLPKLRFYDLIKNKHIPNDYLCSSVSDRLNLLAGLIDSDGNLHEVSGQYKFSNTNKRLIDEFCWLISSLGMSYSLTKSEPRNKPNSFGIQDRKTCYQVAFTQNGIEIPCRIPRKRSNKHKKSRRVSLKSVRWLDDHEKEDGNCITVDSSDGLYCIGPKMIPTHNSEGSSRRLPAYLLGKDPKLRIALASYNETFASKFNREIQRIIDSPEYNKVFPDTYLNKSNVVTVSGSWLRNSSVFETVGYGGQFKSVGVGGPLTGEPVDILILDDLYKDYLSACSPTISENVWEWYLTVAKTRLHNDSQEIIVFTRWDEMDLIGRLEGEGKVVTIDENTDIDELLSNLGDDMYLKINFPAIKNGEPNSLDPRENGEALWPSKHGLSKLIELRELDADKFESLNQGNPVNKEGLMYSGFGEYESLPKLRDIKSITDTADTGKDNLCSIVYGVPSDLNDDKRYIIDVIYTDKSMETTEPMVAEQLTEFGVRKAKIESNNGGRGFARNIEKLTDNHISIKWFHQKENKEARILTNSASVNRTMMFPTGWKTRFPEFYADVSRHKKNGKNKFDDGPDVLTMVYEEEFPLKKKRRLIY